ncbi:MAG: 2-oxoglutarate dehydrogenase complex dihydrolipoyllysine-residue succinyltransferase [Methylococcales bacterium]|nr:2-oxoglutarate dehydrogenase complex dihydrolipoyllysine-residue succinyltransferase [Methylococcales bacterium]
MSTNVLVPNLPESVADATLITWHKKAGDAVTRDETLVDLETDKVVLEVPAPCDGVITKIVVGDGATVTSGELLAQIDESAIAAATNTTAVESQTETESDIPLSPAVRRIIQENQLDPASISGSGKNGRITKEDVQKHLDNATAQPAQAASTPATPSPTTAPHNNNNRPEQRVPMTRLRARVAERLVEAQQTAAMLTTFNEVNMKPVMDLRNKYKDLFQKTHESKLGFMSFFAKAATEALKKFPVVNASIDGKDIIYHGYFDIGIAVSSPRGLVVPILRDADGMGFADIEKQIVNYAQSAKNGSLSYDDLTGGTFTITNGGTFGSMLSTPILNPPQSAILGMHNIVQRPVIENGEIVIRPIMYMAVSYDHRIIDGAEAVQFLVAIKNALEDPARLLLNV